jgi:hypothetical protein
VESLAFMVSTFYKLYVIFVWRGKTRAINCKTHFNCFLHALLQDPVCFPGHKFLSVNLLPMYPPSPLPVLISFYCIYTGLCILQGQELARNSLSNCICCVNTRQELVSLVSLVKLPTTKYQLPYSVSGVI